MSEEDALFKAKEILLSGGVVAVPTETVYGLAANALDETAVKKIFEVKGRPLIDPLITHVYSMEQLEEIAVVPKTGVLEKLAKAFWPGPLTVILERKDTGASKLVSGGQPTIGVRMPGHGLFRELLKEVGVPLAAPSANPFGYVSPTRAAHVQETLGKRVDYILDGGDCEVGIESTIVDLYNNAEVALVRRPGPITLEEIENVLGKGKVARYEGKEKDKFGLMPGQLASHYSPKKALELFEAGQRGKDIGSNEAIVWLERPSGAGTKEGEYWLSEDGDLSEVARNLFRLVQELDNDFRYEKIYVEAPKDEGIGIAINDRLRRAAVKRTS